MFRDIEKYSKVKVNKKCTKCGHVTQKTEDGTMTYEYTSYKEAKKGISYHINEMLDRVKGYEYGHWYIQEVNDLS